MSSTIPKREPTLTLQIELPWPTVTGNHAVKHTRSGGHYKTPKARAYEIAVCLAVGGMGWGSGSGKKPLLGPLNASWLLAPPNHRSVDLDNVRKVAADALTLAGLWTDDSNKVLRREVFDWTDPLPGGLILLTVEVLGGGVVNRLDP